MFTTNECICPSVDGSTCNYFTPQCIQFDKFNLDDAFNIIVQYIQYKVTYYSPSSSGVIEQ